jgi:hypothetical protein
VTSAPTATTAPTISAPTATPNASPVAVQPIPDGTYLSGPQGIAPWMAEVMADATLTSAEKNSLRDSPLLACTNQFVSLDFHGGELTESSACDAGSFEIGTRATYAFPNDHTLVIQESCCGTTTFDLTSARNGFFLKRTGAPVPGTDRLIGLLLYESSPFMPQESTPRALPDGNYVGKTLKVADMIASINADTKLTDAEKHQLIDEVLAIRGHATFAPTFEFRDGKYAQGIQMDGGPAQVGSRGTYAFPDTTTLVLQEQTVTSYHVSWASERVSLAHVGTPNEFDRVIFKFLFESSFSVVP